MARPDQLFDPQSLEATLARVTRAEGGQRVLLLLAGPVRTISPEVRLRVGPSRVVSARAGSRDGVRALGLAFLADTGRLEAADDPSPSPGGGWRPLAVLAPEARAWAEGIREQLRPLGGLSAVLRPSEVGPSALEAAPEVVQQVARLLDGRRTAARVLADAGVDELLTARILARLVADGVAEVLGPDDDADPLLPPPRAESAQFTMPRSGWGQTSALPEADADEFEGAAVADDLRHWLAEEGAPETLLSDAAFQGAYVGPLSPTPSQAPTQAPPPSGPPAAPLPPVITALPPAAPAPEVAPPPAPTPAPRAPTPPPAPAQPPRGGSEAAARVRAQVAYSTRGPGPAEDEDVFRDAGVGQSRSTWVVGSVVLLVALAAAIALLRGEGGSPPGPPDAGWAPPVLTSTVVTATVATATVATATVTPEAPAPDGLRATVAGPDAPEDVREAESLVEGERYPEAEKLLRQLRATRPADPAVFILSGMVYVDTNRLPAASRMADQALALDRRSFRAWVLKGSVLQFQRNDTQALAAYQRALTLGPSHPMSGEIRALVEQLERKTR